MDLIGTHRFPSRIFDPRNQADIYSSTRLSLVDDSDPASTLLCLYMDRLKFLRTFQMWMKRYIHRWL